MNGLYEVTYAESVTNERARRVERRASEAALLAEVTAEHPVRTRLGRGLIRLGMRLAPQVEPPRRARTSPNC
ncbi:hypothetical protein ACFLRH_00085 [Actinomycetota bacterium]